MNISKATSILSLIILASSVSANEFKFEYGAKFSQEIGKCEKLSDMSSIGGCSPISNSILNKGYKGKKGGVIAKWYPNTRGDISLTNTIFIVAPYSFSFGDSGSQSATSESELYFNDIIGDIKQDIPGYSYNNLIQGIRDQGFDIIVFGWPNELNHDYLQRKGQALAMAIDWIQNERAASGTRIKQQYETIIGLSLGGVVTRYALSTLEKHHKNNIETYISFDSPHYGANLPISMQMAMKFIKDSLQTAKKNNSKKWYSQIYIELGYIFDEILPSDWFNFDKKIKNINNALDELKNGTQEAQAMMSNLNTPAVKQLLINHISENQKYFDDLQAEMENLGFPKYSTNITYANSNNHSRLEHHSEYNNEMFSVVTKRIDSTEFHLSLNATENTENPIIFNGKFRYLQGGVPKKIRWYKRSEKQNNYTSIDGGACSYENSISLFSNALISAGFHDNFPAKIGSYKALSHVNCFIPMVSALGIKGDQYTYRTGLPTEFSPFDIVIKSKKSERHLNFNSEFLHNLYRAIHGDADMDGVNYYDEISHNLSPSSADSDGDGISDFQEIRSGTTRDSKVKKFSRPTRWDHYSRSNKNEIWLGNSYGNQFCKEEGFSEMVSYEVGCGADEESFSKYSKSRGWYRQESGSKDRCYDIFESITCGYQKKYTKPLIHDQFSRSNRNRIWFDNTNALQFCRSQGFKSVINKTPECGEDENSYSEYSLDKGKWIRRESGSSDDRCYSIIKDLTCSL